MSNSTPGLSPTANIRLKDGWIDGHDAWQKRDLSPKRYVYVWAEGIYLQARLEDEKQCILVLIGATPQGCKELVGFTGRNWRLPMARSVSGKLPAKSGRLPASGLPPKRPHVGRLSLCRPSIFTTNLAGD